VWFSGTVQRIKGRLESPSTGSDKAFEFMAKCIRTCQSQHEHCINRASPAAWYPTRLLDTRADSAKIIGRDQVAANSQYATLSHRWNPSVPKLSVERLREWEVAGIPPAALTPTLGEFVVAARRLGFRYVWIDCLCIIQDGDGGVDWGRESQTMHLVYRNSACNFSAGWSVEQNTGLFSPRDPSQADQLAVTLSVRETENGEAACRPYLLSNPGASFWANEVASAPLNARGWVVQERFLSPRVLHFGRSEVLFECCESMSAERYPDGPPTNSIYDGLPGFKHFRIDKAIDYDSLCRVWNAVLTAYANCQLTFTSDKLVAISGVARYLRPFFPGCNYIMGIWTHKIERQFMWHSKVRSWADDSGLDSMEELGPATPVTGLPSAIASIPYRAPSFSWASLDGQFYSRNLRYKKTEVTAVIIHYRKNRESGDVVFCEDIYDFLPAPKVEMRIVGRLNRARMVSVGGDWFYLWPQVGDFDLANGSRESFLCGRREKLYGTVNLDFHVTLADVPDIEARMFYYMVWAERRSEEDDPWRPWESVTCVIFALVDQDMGRFRRVGLMIATTRSPDVLRKIDRERVDIYRSRQLATEQATIPCWDYNRETNQHTIYVV
jgi:hypothetical protein